MPDYPVDGLLPAEVISPTRKSEVASHLAELHRQGKSVVPWGGGTRMSIGNLPSGYDVALDLTDLDSDVEHVAGDMTLVCDAGAKIGDLSALLAEANQRLPFELASAGNATIGGSVASNAPSRLAPRFGGIRDWIIGMSVVSADGTPTKSGGRVVKNVQGYDLHRLHTGAFGTLGVIVSVALKLVPLAPGTQTVAMWFDRVGAVADAARDVNQSNISIEAARMYSGPRAVGAIRELSANRHMDIESASDSPTHLMLVQVSGSKSALTRQVNELTGLAGTVPATGYEVLSGASEADIWDYAESTGDATQLALRVASKPMVAIDLVNRLDRAVGRIGTSSSSSIVDVGYGSMQFNVEDIGERDTVTFIAESKDAVRASGGSLVVERCSLGAKREVDVFGIDASSAQIMKNMKQQFDPEGILNPGRFAFKI